MNPRPLLIMSDSPAGPTGLGRICRELALRIHADMSDVFRVGTFGFGGGKSRTLPWKDQYRIDRTQDYVALELEDVWGQFAGDEPGTILTIQNPSWVYWLSETRRIPDMNLRRFVENRPFDLWGYFPVDGDGIGGRLPESIARAIVGFDRVLAYTDYGAKVLDRTLEQFVIGLTKRTYRSKEAVMEAKKMATKAASHARVQHLPHGLDREIFYPQDRATARETFMQRVVGHEPEVGGLRDGLLLLGCVATNSGRKDWPLVFGTVAELAERGIDVALWAHTDALQRHWDLTMMADEFGITDRVMGTIGKLTNDQLAQGYAACDVILGNGSGEGWGLCESESLGMGVPVIHGRYAGAAEFVPEECLVDPVAFRHEGFHAIRRPDFSPADWADKVLELKGRKVELPEYIYWDKCWEEWKRWLLKGVGK